MFILLLCACGRGAPGGTEKANAQAPAQGAAPPPVAARVMTVSVQRIPIRLEAVGQVEGSKEVEVRARVGGIVEKRLYTEGDFVKAGEPLFQIDPVPFQIALEQARAALAQERARNQQARRESGRLKDLAQQKAISQKEYDDATSNLQLSDASMQAAEAKVREAELNLSYTRVTAPVSGVSGRAARSEGSLVSTSDSLLTTVSQITPVWVRFALAEPEVAKLLQGNLPANAEVRLVLGDGSRYAAPGHLNFAASQVDLKLGTRQMRAEFENPQRQLLPGQFVRVEIAVQRPKPVTLVPQAAVLQNEKGHFVFALDASGKAAIRPVETGEWVGSDWVILGGLNAGDRVVTDNLIKMQPGVVVRAAEDKPAGSAAGAKS